MDLFQKMHLEVSLKHTGIKQELYSGPAQDTHANQLQQDISQLQMTTARKTTFFFPDVPKRWLFQKNCAGIWSFLHYRERWYFFFPKTRSYTLDGKWKMIFLKKYTEIWHFLQAFWKDSLSKKGRAGTWSFLYYLERWCFFSRKHNIFFLGRK